MRVCSHAYTACAECLHLGGGWGRVPGQGLSHPSLGPVRVRELARLTNLRLLQCVYNQLPGRYIHPVGSLTRCQIRKIKAPTGLVHRDMATQSVCVCGRVCVSVCVCLHTSMWTWQKLVFNRLGTGELSSIYDSRTL